MQPIGEGSLGLRGLEGMKEKAPAANDGTIIRFRQQVFKV